MNKSERLVAIAAVVAGVAIVLAVKPGQVRSGTAGATTAVSVQSLPKMIEFGSVTCIPCKAMQPTIADLEANYAAKFATEFVDVVKNPDPMVQYDVTIIPTQLFLDAQGKELFRHQGFFAKEQILHKWQELGYPF